ncbi:MAG: D-alanyl-D-alanine carboxypeptidase family protein [Ruminococcaceae bacterium]|nr:D-alanyl-D-alanine carboxypeptidase family protein [Oscillospiraceae bacterium]
MKKIALFLALIMMLSLLTACGGSEENNADDSFGSDYENGTEEDDQDDGSAKEDLPSGGSDSTQEDDKNTEEDDKTDEEDDKKEEEDDKKEEDDLPEDDGKFLEENPDDFKIPFTGYETITLGSDKLQAGDLVLVDAAHPYDSAASGTVVRVKEYNTNRLSMVATSKIHMNFVALRKLQEMTSAMHEALQINYLYYIQAAFLTNDELTDLHANYPNEYPEDGGKCDLNTGRAVVLSVYTGAMNYGLRNGAVKNVSDWTDENAHKYGFIVEENVGENGKLRYVGVPHATYMKENGLDLEGYLTKLQNGDKLQITDHRNLTWTVYHVKASEGTATEVKVPTGMIYDVSGDNNGGYIVTVKGACN